MKRWLYSLLLAVGVVFFLWIPHRPLGPRVHPQDRSVLLSQSGVVSTGCQGLGAAPPAFLRSRAGPLEFFTGFGFLIRGIVDDVPCRWEYRGPPSPNVCSRRDLLMICQAAHQGGSLPEVLTVKFRASGGQLQNGSFATRFS